VVELELHGEEEDASPSPTVNTAMFRSLPQPAPTLCSAAFTFLSTIYNLSLFLSLLSLPNSPSTNNGGQLQQSELELEFDPNMFFFFGFKRVYIA